MLECGEGGFEGVRIIQHTNVADHSSLCRTFRVDTGIDNSESG